MAINTAHTFTPAQLDVILSALSAAKKVHEDAAASMSRIAPESSAVQLTYARECADVADVTRRGEPSSY